MTLASVGREIFAQGLRRVARAYDSLISCATDLQDLRDRFEETRTIYSTPEACGRIVWIAVLDMQQRFVLGTMLEIRRFVLSIRATMPSLAPALAALPPARASERMKDPPLLVLLVDAQKVLASVAAARDDLALAREHVRGFLCSLKGDGVERREWRERLTPPFRALDAGVRALDRFARVLEASLPQLAACGLLSRPSSLEAFG